MALYEINVEKLYEKDKKLKSEDVKALMEWMEKQPHLPKASELQVALFLHSCLYSNEAAKYTIDTYFTVRTICSDLLGTRDIKNDTNLQLALRTTLAYPLPKLTPEGDLVVFCKIQDLRPENFNLADSLNQLDLVILLYLHEHGPPNNIYILIDLHGLSFTHFLKLYPLVFKKFFYYLQEAMPVRLKEIHLWNIVSFIDKILALIKPLMKKELYDSIRLHPDGESLCKKFPREIFPVELGGTCESIETIQEKNICHLNNNAAFFRYLFDQVVDESKRPGKPKNSNDIFGIEGSFKKLELD